MRDCVFEKIGDVDEEGRFRCACIRCDRLTALTGTPCVKRHAECYIQHKIGIGDVVSDSLSAVGIKKKENCDCPKYQKMLNRLWKFKQQLIEKTEEYKMKCRCDQPGHCPWRGVVVTQEENEKCRERKPLEIEEERKKACIYMAESIIGSMTSDKQPQQIHKCRRYDKCAVEQTNDNLASCADCPDYTTIDDPELDKKFIDPLIITARDGKLTDCHRNMLNGGSAFLVCGGPSLNKLDYRRLAERGIYSLGVNNVCAYVPVSAFVCSDPPMKFHDGIFLDPQMTKFIPSPKLSKRRGRLRKKNDRGLFEWIDAWTRECPQVFGFERRSWLMPDETWFTDGGAAWGNHDRGVKKTGELKTVGTMLLGLRILQYLGAKKVFLLGCDFYMNPLADKKENYSFGEDRNLGAIESNNEQFKVLNDWLCRLRPVFEKFGFHTFNCNQDSHLRAFDYVLFEQAMEVCKIGFPKEPFSLGGWYEKKTEEESK